MNLTDFINTFNGQKYLFPGQGEDYRGQCTQICKEWARVNGWPVPNSGGSNRAVDYKNFTGDAYKFTLNTRYGVPNPGDFVIFSGPASETNETKKYGHIAIFIAGNTETFTAFEQNWPKGSACHTQTHGYIGAEYKVIGWLTPKNPSVQNPPVPPPVQEPAPTPTPAPPTPEKYPFYRNLYPGLLHDGDVMQLQNYLKTKNFFPQSVPLTGNYLNITKTAVANLQVQNKIVPSLASYGAGYCGPKTREFINNN